MDAKLSNFSELSNILSVKSSLRTNLMSLFTRFGLGHLLCRMSLEKQDIVNRLAGLILYTDRHGTYFKLQVAGHQVCLVHLLRNLQYLNDLNPEQSWSSGIQELLRDAIHKSKTMPLEQIDKEYYKKKLHEALDADLSDYNSFIIYMRTHTRACGHTYT